MEPLDFIARLAAAQAQLPEAGWEIRSRTSASPALERSVERFTQYLTLVGLTALLVGGVGVANAVKSHLDRRRDHGNRIWLLLSAEVWYRKYISGRSTADLETELRERAPADGALAPSVS